MYAKKILLTLILMTSMGTTEAVNGLESVENSSENLPQSLNKKSIAFGTAAMSAALAGILFSIPNIRREVIAFAKNPTEYKARLQERKLNGSTILLPVTTLAAIAAALIAGGYGALVKDDKATEQGVHTESTAAEKQQKTARLKEQMLLVETEIAKLEKQLAEEELAKAKEKAAKAKEEVARLQEVLRLVTEVEAAKAELARATEEAETAKAELARAREEAETAKAELAKEEAPKTKRKRRKKKQ